MDLERVVPPDDTGSNTYRRYRYQGEIAFPYVLACALDQGVEAVIIEHIEDVAVLSSGIWTLRQVKTRDAGLGPWKASDIRASGGGLDSLYRAYRATQSAGIDCVFELFLEGGTKNGDNIEHIVAGTACDETGIVEAVHRSLAVGDDQCSAESVRDFLSRTKVVSVLDTRATIESRNLRLIAAVAPRLNGPQQEAVYREFMSLIDRAMAAEGDDLLARALFAERDGASRKALRREDLSDLAVQLTGGVSVLLRRMVVEGPSMTTLVQKLDLGKASHQVIEDAKSLRAQASAWELEQMSAGNIDNDEETEDVRFRLEILSNAVVAELSTEALPADRVWSSIHARLHAAPKEYDRNGLYGADPVLLMGEVCDMSDQCRVGWGVARA